MAAASIVIDLIAKVGGFTTDTARAERSLKSLQNQIGATRRVSEGFGDSFGNVGNQLKSLAAIGVGGFGVASLAQAADSYTKFTAQLKLATNDAQSFGVAYNEVIRIASKSQSDIESIGTLYARLSRNLKDVGITSQQLSDTTETVALALRVSGATAKETASVLLQLSQAFGAGRLNGQEFAAVAEAAPVLLQQLAKSLGVPIGALKNLAAEGKLTRQELLKAFTNPEFLTSLQAQVKEVQTVSSSITELKNRFTIFIGEQDKASGASKTFASGILLLAENLNVLATVAIAGLIVKFGAFTGGIYQNILAVRAQIAVEQASIANKQRLLVAEVTAARARLATISGIQVQNIALANNAQLTTLAATRKVGLIQAELALATATAASTASVTLFSRAIGFLGGPIGALITVLGLGLLAFNSFGNGAETATEKLRRLREEAKYSSNENQFAKDLDLAVARYNKALGKVEELKAKGVIGNIFGSDGGLINAQAELDGAKKILDETRKAYDEYDKDIKARNKNTPFAGSVDTSGFEGIESKLKTITALTREYNLAVADATKQAKEQGIGQDRLNEVLAKLKTQYDKDIAGLKEKTTKEQKYTDTLIVQIKELENTNRLLAQGVDAEDASFIAKANLAKASDALIVKYLNLKNANESYIKTEKDKLQTLEDVKKLNEEALTPLEKLTAQYDKLAKLQSSGLTEQGFNKGLKNAVSDFESASSGALSYGNVLEELNGLYDEATKAGFNVKNVSLELTIAYNQLFDELKNGTIAKDEYIRKSQELLKTASDEAKRISELSQILSQTDTSQLEEQRRLIALIYEEYGKGTNEALDSVEELGEAVRVVLGQQNVEVETSADFLEAAFKRAAENAQDAFADFLFDPFKDGLDGMLLGFVNVLKRMAAEALAAEIFKKLLGNTSTTGKLDSGSWLGQLGGFFSSIFGGGKASGGDVIAGREYLVGERGPEMFTPRTNGTITPNNQLANNQPANVNVKNINVLDPSLVGSYLNTDAGERVIMNIMQRNRKAFDF